MRTYDVPLNKSVWVDREQIAALASEWAPQEFVMPSWREPWYPEDDETFLQFIGIANALNFCYTEPGKEKFAIQWNDMLLSGSAGLMAALLRAREEGTDILDPRVLERLTPERVRNIFRSDAGPLPLLNERWSLLKFLGLYFSFIEIETFEDIFRNCAYRADRIIAFLTQKLVEVYGRDVAPSAQGGHRFDKRARLLPLMYAGRAQSSEGLRPLTNAQAIGPVVDYQVAKTLRQLGALEYVAELDSKIEQGIPLVAWSDEEFGIRSASAYATEELQERINDQRRDVGLAEITMVELDYRLWSSGRKLPGSHHPCMTTAY